MSHSGAPNDPAKVGNGNSLDASLSRAIDAMSLLREDLRREGHLDVADTIDVALVKCLALYVERENAKTDGATDLSNGSGQKPG